MSSRGLEIRPKNFPANPNTTGEKMSGFRTNKRDIETEKKEPLNNKKNAKILLVEDNGDHAYLTMKVLSLERHYQVELAPSGSEALHKLKGGEFSLILLDYCMSGMNGLQLIRKIKELHYNIPIIMITGLGSESVAVEAMKSGVYDYITKSGNYLDALSTLIDKALEKYELEGIKKQWDHWMFERNLKLGALNSIYETLGKSLNPDDVLKEAVSKTVEALRADYGHIRLMEEIAESAPQDLQRAAGAPVRTIVKSSAIGEEGPMKEFLQQAIGTGESLVLEDTTRGQVFYIQGAPKENLRSVAYIPLKSQETVLGVMILGSYRKSHFIKEDTGLLNVIGNHIGSAWGNAKRYEGIRRQAERIKESENKYRALVEGANDAIFIVQGSGLQYANKKACELLGYTTEEFCRMDFLDLVTPEYEYIAATYYAAKVNGKDVPSCEIAAVRRNGEMILLEINGSLIEYKSQPALQIIARHVTEEKYLQELLREGSWI